MSKFVVRGLRLRGGKSGRVIEEWRGPRLGRGNICFGVSHDVGISPRSRPVGYSGVVGEAGVRHTEGRPGLGADDSGVLPPAQQLVG
jgi:hypothetical protein